MKSCQIELLIYFGKPLPDCPPYRYLKLLEGEFNEARDQYTLKAAKMDKPFVEDMLEVFVDRLLEDLLIVLDDLKTFDPRLFLEVVLHEDPNEPLYGITLSPSLMHKIAKLNLALDFDRYVD